MQADLNSLLALQDQDRIILDIRSEMQGFDPELADLDGAKEKVEQTLSSLREELESATSLRDDFEKNIETFKVMQDRRRQKLEWVRGAKEASALMAEIDAARSVIAKEEAEWVRAADRAKEIEQAVAEEEERLVQLVEEQAPRRSEIAAAVKSCEKKIAKVKTTRADAAKNVSRQLLVVYDRVLRGRAPLALYELHGDACGHCYTSVPMHLLQQIRRNESVTTCEACGVIMYYIQE
ncbi:MAG: hypothetical protein OEZ54_06655 [Gemmatimonadota bacterium]|nr:hypothetical protein [Gemmatimonadota bacterium]